MTALRVGGVYDVYVQEHDSHRQIVWRRCTLTRVDGDLLWFDHPDDVYEELDLADFCVEKWNLAKVVEVG